MSKSLTDEEIFAAALRIQATSDRLTYLEQTCAGNIEQLARVKSLLAALDDAGSFLNKPLADFAAVGATVTPDPNRGADQSQSVPAAVRLDFLTPSDNPDALGKLGPYVVEDVIGRGGMGIVLRAVDPKLNRVVAIKVLSPELARNPMAGKRFLREAQAAAAVSHDHVVRIYAVEDAAVVPYLVMECIVGQSLQQKIERKGILEIREILRIGNQIASGLAAAHNQGLVHRDIKPANILLENGIERVKITDFGLARTIDDVAITQSGQVTGTPQYMSPEQAMGEQVDHRSDLFSLGSVLYTMCTGRPAFRATSTVAVLRRVVDDAPRPIRELNPEAPDWLIAIVDRLMAKKPEDRYQTAQEVAVILEQWLAHYQRPQTVAPPVHAGPSAKTAVATGTAKGTLRRAWDEWWSERDRWIAISVQSVLVILHIVCMICFLNFLTSRSFDADRPHFQFQMGAPFPWYKFEINQGDQRGFSSSFHPFTWSVLLGLMGWALYYLVWRIEKARDPKASWWNRHEVVMSLWGLMALCGVVVGTIMGHGILNRNPSVSKLLADDAGLLDATTPTRPGPTLIAEFDQSRLTPTMPPWAGTDGSAVFQEGAWRIENNTNQGNFNVLLATILENIPLDGIIAFRAKVKVEPKHKFTWGDLQLGDRSPDMHGYDWPESMYTFRGNVSEWTEKEIRYPAKVFHEKNPPQILVYVGLHANGVLWLKDLELLHLPEGQTHSPAVDRKAVKKLTEVKPAAVLEELRKQVELAATELEVVRKRHISQAATLFEVRMVERTWNVAKLRLAEAEGERDVAVEVARSLVRLAEDDLQMVQARMKASAATPQDLRSAEKVLSEAKLRLAELEPDTPEPPSLPE